MQASLYPMALALAIAYPASAQEAATMPEVRVLGARAQAQPAGADASALLAAEAGYSVAAGGGVSGLPMINGLGDDRIKIRVDGMEITSACANHMNAPLSYVDPRQVGAIRLVAGLTPVSLGGDSIAGTIEVQSAAPAFAADAGALLGSAKLAWSARSVDHGVVAGVGAAIASDRLSLSYEGSRSRAASYRDGNGDTVLDTLYQSSNQSVALAARADGQALTLRLGRQRIPYQGFPNQYMDMTRNAADYANALYTGVHGWGKLTAKLYWQNTAHEMGFFSAERPGMMPMHTHGRDLGYAVQAELALARDGALRLGQEVHRFTLEDAWPAVPDSMMMGPQTYLNVHDGRRQRVALYAEWEQALAAGWSTELGLRGERVATGAGRVQPYGDDMMNADDVAAARVFNARPRARRDNNVDLTALARYTPGPGADYVFGYARKTRSPNLYERYSWGRGEMAMTMTNWFGDGNGYVGDPDLRPEVAHTLRASAAWRDAARGAWSVTLSPYYTLVRDYVDADVVGAFAPYMIMGASGALLRFANHDARLYGVNLSWEAALGHSAALGRWRLGGNASAGRGTRTDGGSLYHMMPATALLALDQQLGRAHNTVELRWVGAKHAVDGRRLEPVTGGYTLLNARSRYQATARVGLSAGVSNLLKRQYADPLGGVNLAGLADAGAGPLRALPGYGRSFDVGMTVAF